jgi:hypothetical protein
VELDNSFEVPLRPAEAWPLLMDIRRIAPCMPGAEVTEVVDDKTYKGRIAVRLGPVALTFAGVIKFEELDGVNYKARVKAQGSDAKGRGAANATASFRLEPAGSGTAGSGTAGSGTAGSGTAGSGTAGSGTAGSGTAGSGTKVLVHTDLALSGAVAQYGRGVGIIQATAASIMTQFAANLKAQIGKQNSAATLAESSQEPPPAAARPISGLSLIARVIWDAVVRLFRRA